jgi:tetratricopeptide (TPR) repeat protein
MHDTENETSGNIGSGKPEPRSQLGLYRSYLTSPEHRRYITVGRESILSDTIALLRENIGKKPKHHQLFIAPRGSGKTHFLSLIEDEINGDAELKQAYRIVRFPEEANRVCSFADFLLTTCEVLQNNYSEETDQLQWKNLFEELSTEEDDKKLIDILGKAIRDEYKKSKRIFILMVENLNQILEKQMKNLQSVQALRGFLMGDNGCLLIGTSPMHFGSLAKADQPFYDFFDIQVLDLLDAEETIKLIRRNLEWDKREDILMNFNDIRPKLRAIHTMTGGNPRLAVMLYELISTESIIAVKDQFLKLMDRITPFYQDRMRDLSPQEKAILETIASMRDKIGKLAPPKTPGNIAKHMRMSQQQVSSLLNRLTKALYLVSMPNPDDARSTIYTIREGFFDLWIAMNQSRSLQQRIPLLSDFFTAFYEQDEARRQKRAEYWKKLDAGEFNADAAENLSYLSTVGKPDEQATEKIRLIPKFLKAGYLEGSAILKRELSLLPMDPTGRWIFDRMNGTETNYLDEISELIKCWETKRQGGLEAFAQRLREMGEQLSYKIWSNIRIEFIKDQVDTIPLSVEKVETHLTLARFLSGQARWKEAELQSKAALEAAESLKNDALISCACNNYALVLKDTNRLSEAEPLMRRALDIDEVNYGKNDPNVAIYLNNLAQLLHVTNRISEAEPLMRRALAMQEENYGEDDPRVAICLSNLAELLKDTNRLNEAESLMRRAMAIQEANYGKDDPTVALCLNNLAQLLCDTNRLREAEPLMRRALTIDEISYGVNHPDVAIDLNNLALLLLNTNRLNEAEPLMRRALTIEEKSFGDNHPKVATSLNNLAQLLLETNRLSEAENLMRRAMTIDQESFGDNHPKVGIRLNNLAQLLQDTNRLSEAEPMMIRSLKIALQFSCDTSYLHPSLIDRAKNCFSLLNALGYSEEKALENVARLFNQYNVPLPPELLNEK